MPTDDPRLERALHDAAPAVDTSGVVERVAHRRSRRHRNQRLAVGAGVLALFLVVGSVTLALMRRRRRFGTPDRGAQRGLPRRES